MTGWSFSRPWSPRDLAKGPVRTTEATLYHLGQQSVRLVHAEDLPQNHEAKSSQRTGDCEAERAAYGRA
jgi:hypothetical protein